MKRNRIAAAVILGALLPTASASAWWQWFHQDTPYAPGRGIWLYQNVPQGPALGQAPPWFWRQQPMPGGWNQSWFSAMPMNSLFVEQSHGPLGFTIRVRAEHPATRDIDIGLEGHALVIKKRSTTQTAPGAPMQAQQSGWSTQWVSLPTDANVSAMRISRGNGLVEIFVPRAR